jgi:NADH-quinone oxidoreductase subunit J
MSELTLPDLLFLALGAFTVVASAGVAFSRNIVYSAFSLMGTFMGVAGLYVFLAADFVAVVQVLIYVGGILILMLFAVMLTHRIADVRVSNRSVGQLPALGIAVIVGAMMTTAVMRGGWHRVEPTPAEPTTAEIGNLFLTKYILPFELASVILLAALIGAVYLSRKELRDS